MSRAICFLFPNDLGELDGSRLSTVHHALGLGQRGFTVEVLCIRSDRDVPTAFRGVRTLATLSTGNRKLDYVLFPLTASWKLKMLERQFDLIIARTAPAAAAALKCTKPVIYHLHDWQYLLADVHNRVPFWPRRFDVLVDALDRKYMLNSSAVTVTSPLLLQLLREYLPSVTGQVVPNGVDPYLFTPDESSGHKSQHVLTVGFIGSSRAQYGLMVLLHALQIARRTESRIRALVVGNVSDRMIDQARLLGLQDVQFAGQVEYHRLPKWINEMDICVSPLQRIKGAELYTEFAQPFKVLESMACAKPVIVTPLQEQRRIVNEADCGFVTKDFTSRALAECIQSAFETTDLTRHGRNGRGYVMVHHTWEKSCDALASLCDRFVPG
jgi:glycosyltransferase involved in cell wall biosynthesis